MRSLAPAPAIKASLILSAIFWGQNVPVRPYLLPLLILLVGTKLRLLILVLIYIKLFVVLQT